MPFQRRAFALLLLLGPALVSCENQFTDRSIRTFGVANLPPPDRLSVQVAAGGNAAIAPRALDAMVRERGISIESIATHAFQGEIQKSGVWFMAPVREADGILLLTIDRYGLTDAPAGAGAVPFITMDVDVMKNGKTLFFPKTISRTAGSAFVRPASEFAENPELLRAGWEDAAGQVAREVFAQMRSGLAVRR